MNLKKTNMIIGSEIAGKFTEEGKFPCAVWRKDVKVCPWEQKYIYSASIRSAMLCRSDIWSVKR